MNLLSVSEVQRNAIARVILLSPPTPTIRVKVSGFSLLHGVFKMCDVPWKSRGKILSLMPGRVAKAFYAHPNGQAACLSIASGFVLEMSTVFSHVLFVYALIQLVL